MDITEIGSEAQSPDQPSVKQKLHSETALFAWRELQRFFAQGVVIVVDESLDLVEIATMFAEDRANELQVHTETGTVAAPSDQQARDWYLNNAQLWSVVVAPYVLVQDSPKSRHKPAEKAPI